MKKLLYLLIFAFLLNCSSDETTKEEEVIEACQEMVEVEYWAFCTGCDVLQLTFINEQGYKTNIQYNDSFFKFKFKSKPNNDLEITAKTPNATTNLSVSIIRSIGNNGGATLASDKLDISQANESIKVSAKTPCIIQ